MQPIAKQKAHPPDNGLAAHGGDNQDLASWRRLWLLNNETWSWLDAQETRRMTVQDANTFFDAPDKSVHAFRKRAHMRLGRWIIPLNRDRKGSPVAEDENA